MKLKDLRVGSIVRVYLNFGTGPLVRGEVLNLEKDIKNGYPGIDFRVLDQKRMPLSGDPFDERWAYLDAVAEVVKF